MQVGLTYPARWGSTRMAVLRDAATRAGLGDVLLISEPEAAAAYFAKHDHVPLGRTIAVYDLGGGTLDVALLAATPEGFRLVGRPGGMNPLGGDGFDVALLRITLSRALQQVGEAEKLAQPPDVEWQARAAALRQEVRRAKEDLATVDPAQLVLPGLGVGAELSRADLRDACAQDVDASVDEFLRTVELAGVRVSDLAGIYLAGGSSRLPMVGEALTRKLPAPSHRLIRTLHDPKAAVAQGAAELLFRRESAPEPPAPIVRTSSRLTFTGLNRVLVAVAVVALVVGGFVWLRHRDTNEISGVVRDSRGEPLANAALVMWTGDEDHTLRTRTDGDGHYSGHLPRGDYMVEAEVTLPYEGTTITVPLAPHEEGDDVFKLPASGGVKLDLDVHVSGERIDAAGIGEGGYYGYTALVYEGYDYDGTVTSFGALREDLEIAFEFRPSGPLVDGSEGKPVVMTRTVGELLDDGEVSGHDANLRDLPLGSYEVTATLDVGDGTTIPLLILGDDGATWSENQTISLVDACYAGCDIAQVTLQVGIDSTYLA